MKTILIILFASAGLFSDSGEFGAFCLIVCVFLSAISESKKIQNPKK
jgi:hypothetical protein